MGYINKNDKVILNAFYTQKGRTFYLNGNDIDKKITHFSIGDSDVNYIIGINNQVNTDTNNILKSGFVPDLTGDYNNCLNGIADGIEINNLVNYKPSGNTDFNEIRFFNNENIFNGINVLNIKIDLSKYISWLKYYGKYSVNMSDSYNKIEQNLSSPFIKFYNNVGIFNTNDDSISAIDDVTFSFNGGDYNNYEKLNRFLIDTTLSSNFKTIVPSNGYQSSPLSFLFTSKDNLGNNGGNAGVIINNRDYVYIVKDNNNVSTTYTYDNFMSGVTLDTTLTYDITPAVIVNYYKNNVITKEVFKMRANSNIINGNITNNNNQYLKLFVNDSNKTLIVREAELLEEFIMNRTDLFNQNNNGIYSSRPLTIYCNTTDDNLNTNYGTLKISFIYDPNLVYTPIPNDTFII